MSEMYVLKAHEHRVTHDRLVIDGKEYSLAEVREALALLNQAMQAEAMPRDADG